MAADAAVDAWNDVPWPDGLLSYGLLLGADGRTILHYSQWTGEDAVARLSFATDTEQIARYFVDTLLDEYQPARDPEAEPVPGMASNHFHIAVDGTSVVNDAGFRDEAAHQAVVDSRLRGGDPVPAFIAATPGLTPLGFRRYLPYRQLTPPGD